MSPWAAPCALTALLLVAPGQARDQAWKNRPISEWTETDAKTVITDSPWAMTVTATLETQSPRGKGIKIGGLDIPGLGHGGAGHSADHSKDNKTSKDSTAASAAKPPSLMLRWESAPAIREAERKAHDSSAPAIEEGYYVIAVYGIPRGTIAEASKDAAEGLKKQAVLKRYAKKDLKPTRVQIVPREDGPVVVYLFAKSGEITWRDHNIELDAQVGQWKFTQSFSLDDMIMQGNLEL